MSSHSSDEGEIVENGVVETLKASTLPNFDGSGVDRRDRLRARLSASPSSELDVRRDPSTGPRRSHSPRGFKRSRDERDSAPQEGRAFYDDPPSRDGPRRSLTSYEDLDGPARASEHGYDDRGRDRDRDWRRDRDYELDRDRDRYHDHDRDRDGRHDRARQWDGYQAKRRRNRSRSPRRRPRKDRPRGTLMLALADDQMIRATGPADPNMMSR